MIDNLPRYDRRQTYEWNCEHAPEPVECDAPAVPGKWEFCGLPVDSPLGVPAGPLLNGRWCLYYASLGFDVLTYKTVRSRERKCYPLPNLQPVETKPLCGHEADLPAVNRLTGSWAVSYGMPSKAPEVWREDVEQTRKRLPAGKLLCVSVVGSVQDGWTIDELADDYAQCARWAVESGADCVEANYSCPNVSTCDGQLYQQPHDAGQVAQRIRAAVGKMPFLVKVGHAPSDEQLAALIAALAPHVDGLAMTNSVAAIVKDGHGRRLFDGQKRGICGAAILEASLDQIRRAASMIAADGYSLRLVGVGGVSNVQDVLRYLQAEAQAVHIATAAMTDPAVGLRIRRELAEGLSNQAEQAEGGGQRPHGREETQDHGPAKAG